MVWCDGAGADWMLDSLVLTVERATQYGQCYRLVCKASTSPICVSGHHSWSLIALHFSSMAAQRARCCCSSHARPVSAVS